VDEYGLRLTLLASGRHAQIRSSVVDSARCDATYYHVVTVGCLVLDGGTGVG
jgi:hypothetical protein